MSTLYGNSVGESATIGTCASVTLASTAKALYTASEFLAMGGHYFALKGRLLRIRLFGVCTSAATPGNVSFAIYYGTGADANGVLLASSTPVAWTGSQSDKSFTVEVEVACVTTGTAGTLFCTGFASVNVASVASTLQPILIPTSAPVVSAACDLTLPLIVSVQMLRSGSTAETAQIHQATILSFN